MYKTNNIVVAAALKHLGQKLEDVELARTTGGKTYGIFCFRDSVAQLAADIEMGRVVVEPNGFNADVRLLSTIVNRKKNG